MNEVQRVLSIIPSKGKTGFNSLLALFQAEVMGHDDSPTLRLQGPGRSGFILFSIKIENKQPRFLNRDNINNSQLAVCVPIPCF